MTPFDWTFAAFMWFALGVVYLARSYPAAKHEPHDRYEVVMLLAVGAVMACTGIFLWGGLAKRALDYQYWGLDRSRRAHRAIRNCDRIKFDNGGAYLLDGQTVATLRELDRPMSVRRFAEVMLATGAGV